MANVSNVSDGNGKPIRTGMQNIRRMYDGFTNKDMSFSQFAKEMKALADPVRLRQDVDNMMIRRAIRRTAEIRAKKEIDRAMGEPHKN